MLWTDILGGAGGKAWLDSPNCPHARRVGLRNGYTSACRGVAPQLAREVCSPRQLVHSQGMPSLEQVNAAQEIHPRHPRRPRTSRLSRLET